MSNAIKIQLQKCEKVNDGILYIYYKAKNIQTGEVRQSKSDAYYGDDIINFSILSENELMELPKIHGKRYGSEIVINEEIKTYSEDNAYEELEAEGCNTEIHKAIEYVLY